LGRLAGLHGSRKGHTRIGEDETVRNVVLGMMVDHPHASVKLTMRALRARFGTQDLPSYRSVQRWVKAWKAKNKQLHTALTNPDKWRSHYQSAGGKADEHILRLNQRWETDGTKADLLLSDGSRHTITGMIDVWSRRLKLHVSRSSTSAAVAATLRRALVDWGVPEEVGTDNGSDFVSHHMKRVFENLGVHQDIAPPFTPTHKPFIERAFGTFCRDLVELLPGFIGHNVAERQDIEARRSFAARMMKQGERIEIGMSAEELQEFCDRWTDTIYAIEPHGGLDGKSPFQRAAEWSEPVARIEDERALDILLAPAPDGDGIRQVTKKGIRIDHGLYSHVMLGGREGMQVRVLFDESDIGEVYVFGAEDGEFICKAICPERGDISRSELAVARKHHQKRLVAEQKAALKSAARKT
ncbi:MAG: Mu transposase C-terminal domain-containing protein, partial [Steroidobacteraceae bacterium]